MRRRTIGRILGGLLGLAAFTAAVGGVRAGDGPSDAELAKLGLKRSGPLFLLEAESEVHAKANEVRHLSRQLSQDIARQQMTVSPEQHQAQLKLLNAQLNQYKTQLNATRNALNRIPKRRGYPVNYALYQQLTYNRNMLQAEVNQGTAFLNQVKNQKFDPKARLQADADVRNRREERNLAVQDLRKLVDGLLEKYAAVAKEPSVQKWLEVPEGSAGVKPKLGPSHAIRLDIKMLEQLERAAGGGDSSYGSGRATRRGRRSRTAKQTAPAGDSASPF